MSMDDTVIQLTHSAMTVAHLIEETHVTLNRINSVKILNYSI